MLRERHAARPASPDRPRADLQAAVLLSAKVQNQIYVPAGFAHGFLALSDPVQFLYKCGDFYDAEDQHGIVWNDPGLNIPWGAVAPLVSEKDGKAPKLADIPRELLPRYTGK